ELGEERLTLRHIGRVGPRPWLDQVQPEPAEEQFLAEAGLAPLALPGGLGYLPGLALRDVPGLVVAHLAVRPTRLALRRGHGHPQGSTAYLLPGYPRLLPGGRLTLRHLCRERVATRAARPTTARTTAQPRWSPR